jgi:hypothetical protein
MNSLYHIVRSSPSFLLEEVDDDERPRLDFSNFFFELFRFGALNGGHSTGTRQLNSTFRHGPRRMSILIKLIKVVENRAKTSAFLS